MTPERRQELRQHYMQSRYATSFEASAVLEMLDAYEAAEARANALQKDLDHMASQAGEDSCADYAKRCREAEARYAELSSEFEKLKQDNVGYMEDMNKAMEALKEIREDAKSGPCFCRGASKCTRCKDLAYVDDVIKALNS